MAREYTRQSTRAGSRRHWYDVRVLTSTVQQSDVTVPAHPAPPSQSALPPRPAPWIERVCLEIGHRGASVALLVLGAGLVVQQIGKDASLLFPVAFAFANLALAGGLGALAVAQRRRTRRLEALGVVVFCVVLLVPLVILMVRIRTGQA